MANVFFAMTAEVLGAVIPGALAEVISGAEEAELSFNGAVGELDSAAAPFVVVDLGGGSTEVVLGSAPADGGVQASFSADIGCVRLTERCLHSDPPTAAEVAAARDVVRERVETLVRGAVDDITDPFSLARLEGDDLSANPGRLVEEAYTVPLFGGRRAVWLRVGPRAC